MRDGGKNQLKTGEMSETVYLLFTESHKSIRKCYDLHALTLSCKEQKIQMTRITSFN